MSGARNASSMTISWRSVLLALTVMSIATVAHAQGGDPVVWQMFKEDVSRIDKEFNTGQYREVIASVPVLRNAYPDFYDSQPSAFKANMAYMFGVSLYNAGYPKGAVSELSAAIRKSPTIQAHYRRGLAYAALGEPGKAIDDFTQALSMAPPDPDTKAELLFQRAQQHYGMSNADEALNDLNAAISIKENGLLYGVRGEIYLNRQAYEKARADFDKALALGVGDEAARVVSIRQNRAAAAAYLGDLEAAILDYTWIISAGSESTPDRLDAHMALALIYHMQRDRDAAMADYDVVFAQLDEASEPTRAKALAIIDGLKRAGLYDGSGEQYDPALRGALAQCVADPACRF